MTSARSSSASATARPSSCRRFSAMLRLPRLSSSKGGLIGTSMPGATLNGPRLGPPGGGSPLITDAPQSAMMPAAAGPATQNPSSTTRIPCKGPDMRRLIASGDPRRGTVFVPPFLLLPNCSRVRSARCGAQPPCTLHAPGRTSRTCREPTLGRRPGTPVARGSDMATALIILLVGGYFLSGWSLQRKARFDERPGDRIGAWHSARNRRRTRGGLHEEDRGNHPTVQARGTAPSLGRRGCRRHDRE